MQPRAGFGRPHRSPRGFPARRYGGRPRRWHCPRSQPHYTPVPVSAGMLQPTATRLWPLLVGLPSKTANAAPWGSPRTAILPEGRSKGPANTVPPSSRAFSTASSRDEPPHSQPANVQDGVWLSDIGYDANGLDGVCLLCARRTPSDASGVLPENQSSEVRALRKGTLPSHRQGHHLLFCPAAGTMAEASTTRISRSSYSRSSDTVVSRSSG